MKKFFAFSVLSVAIFALLISGYACKTGSFGLSMIKGNGIAKTEIRTLADFKKIVVDGSCDLLVTCGKSQNVEVTCDSNLLSIITTEVRDSVLRIGTKNNISISRSPSLVISMADLSSVTINGSADITVADLNNDKLEVKINGSGDIVSKGKTKELLLQVNGSSDIDAKSTDAENVKVDIVGSGDARVLASKSLTVSIVGSGDIEYWGNPASVNQNIAGSGSVKKGF